MGCGSLRLTCERRAGRTQADDPTTCNFQYAGALTETVLLGNVAHRSGKKFDGDAANLKAHNCPEADAFLRREYRKGWNL